MPARACASGGARVRSKPAKTIRPPVGAASPARQLKNVDLPAPFGPMRPIISPSSTARSAPATARNVPNALDTLVASSSMEAFPQTWREASPKFGQTARLEPRDHDDDAAIEDVSEAGAAAAEPGVGGGLQRHQDQGADQRTEQGAGAAERGDDHHLHRDKDAEGAVGIDEPGLDDIERAGDRGEGGGKRERFQFGTPRRHAEISGGALARLDGAKIKAEAAALDDRGGRQQHGEHAKEDIIVRQLAAERQVPPASSGRRALQTDGRADQTPGAGEDSDQLGHRERRHAEIMSGQPEGRQTDCERKSD